MENQAIIVKKIKKGGHGHHGGAWKVAFADFATAMMAFFLLLWLIASTTKEEQAGLSEYFSPPTQGLADGSGTKADIIDLGGGQKIQHGDDSKKDAREAEMNEIQQAIEAEKKRLESLMDELKQMIESSVTLQPFKDQLLLDITPEGLRIQIVDKEGRPMFDSGKATPKPYLSEILREIGKVIDKVSNKVSISGHTDATPFVSRKGYSNWELSTERANAARRELVAGGYAPEKVAEVVGLASRLPFDREHPRDPINRRISIIVLNKEAEKALLDPAAAVADAAGAEAALQDGSAPVRRFRSAIGERRVLEAKAREAQADHTPDAAHEVVPPAPRHAEQIHEPIGLPSLPSPAQPAPAPAAAQPSATESASALRLSERIRQLQRDKAGASDLPEPDYTGMTISERIKARAEWNRKRQEAAGH